MARTASVEELAAKRGRPLGFEHVPERFRPSQWRQYLDAVPPTVTGHRERTYSAMRRRSDDYLNWLAGHGLTSRIGQPSRGWDTTSFSRWEENHER